MDRFRIRRSEMKTKLLGLAAALLAMFATTATAATKLAGTGCCPFCK
jgi:hypothetical protein